MNRGDFILLEYKSLREEIRDTKSRIFKIMGIGILGVPTANFLANTYKIDILALSLPIIVLVIGLIYLSENHALMRCGIYIKEKIEMNFDDVDGWECWLSEPDLFRKRTVDRFLFTAFYLLYLVYYAGSSYIAFKFVIEKYGIVWSGVASGLYIAVGFWSAIFIFKNRLESTTTAVSPKK